MEELNEKESSFVDSSEDEPLSGPEDHPSLCYFTDDQAPPKKPLSISAVLRAAVRDPKDLLVKGPVKRRASSSSPSTSARVKNKTVISSDTEAERENRRSKRGKEPVKIGGAFANSTIAVVQPRRKKKAKIDHDRLPRPDEVSDTSYDSEKEKEIIRERLKDTDYVARKYGKPVTNIAKLRIKPKRVKKNKEMGPPLPPDIAPLQPRLSETTSDDNQTPKRAWMQEQNKRVRSSMATTATVTSKLPAKKVKGRVSTLSLKDHIASTVSSPELDLPLSQDPATKRIIRRSSTLFQPRKLNASIQSNSQQNPVYAQILSQHATSRLQTSNLSQGSEKSSQSDVDKSASVSEPPPPEAPPAPGAPPAPEAPPTPEASPAPEALPPPEAPPAPEAPPSQEGDVLNAKQKSAELPVEGDEEMGIESNLEEGPVVDENSEGTTEDDFEFEKSQFAITPKKPSQRRSSVVPSSRQRDTDTDVESDKEPVVEPSTTKTGTEIMTSRQASLRSSPQKGRMVSPLKKQKKAGDSASAVAPSPHKKSSRVSSSSTSTSGASPKPRKKRKTFTMPKGKKKSAAKKRPVEVEEEVSAAHEYEVLEDLNLGVAKTPNKTSRHSSSVHRVNKGRQSIAPNLTNHSTNLQISPIISDRRKIVVPVDNMDTDTESDEDEENVALTTKTGTERMTSRHFVAVHKKGQMVSPAKNQKKAGDSASAVAPSPHKKSSRVSSSSTSTSGASPKPRKKRKTLTMPKGKKKSAAKKRPVEVEEEASAADEYEVFEDLDLEVAKTPNKTSRRSSSVQRVNKGRQSIAPNPTNYSTNLQISPIISDRRKSVVPVDNMDTDTESDEEEEDAGLTTKTGAKKMSTTHASNVSSQNHRQSQPPLNKRKSAQEQQVVEADSVVEEPVVATKKAKKATATASKTQGRSKVSSRPSLSIKRQQQQPKKKKRQVMDKQTVTEESDDSEASSVSQEEHSGTSPPALNRTGATHNSAHISKSSTSTSGAALKGKKKQQPVVTKPKSKGQEKDPEWGPHHPFMRGPGKVFYNKNLASASLLKSSLDKYSPDVKLTKDQEKTLLKNVNSYIEKTLDKLCDKAPMEYGAWSFKQLMSQMKKDGLMEEDETPEDFIAAMKDAVGEETAKKAEGWIVPKKGKTDTLDIYH